MSISMPLRSTLRGLRSALCTAALLAAAGMGTAQGANMVISAEFRPSALDPGRNTFTNTTPRGQYCRWKPEHCSRLNSYVVDLPINIVAKTYVRGPDARKRFYIGLPGPRRVSATNEAGNSIDVNVVISSLSGQLSPGNRSNPVFTAYPSGGCSYVYTAGGTAWTRFGWNVRTPEAPTPCHSVGQQGEEGFTRVYASQVLGFGLTVTTDSPLGMQNGLYRGSLQFTVGGLGADIDFGDDVEMTDDMLVMDFEFRVMHDFKVERAPGTETIVLQPENGWRNWIEQGHAPRSIRQELPFLMTSSGDFNVRINAKCRLASVVRSAAMVETVPPWMLPCPCLACTTQLPVLQWSTILWLQEECRRISKCANTCRADPRGWRFRSAVSHCNKCWRSPAAVGGEM